MTRLLAIVSEQGTACCEACLCERCHANPKHRADVENKAARIGDVPNPADWHDATGNDALTCNVCGYPKLLVWVRVGDMGEYESFDSLDDALDYLNELKAGEVTAWVDGGMGVGVETVNYHGYDFVSLFWRDDDANLTAHLDAEERMEVEEGLEKVYI
jgi:hypothetical protein